MVTNRMLVFVLSMLVSMTGLAAELRPLPQPVAAPALSLPDLGGRTHALADLRGRVVLVNFWASWCRPCLAEMPSMQALSERLGERPFSVLAVDVEESKATVWRFAKLLGLDFTLLLDADGSVAERWEVAIYPTSYLIDTEGRIRYAARGALEWDRPGVVETIEALLPDAAAAVPTGPIN